MSSTATTKKINKSKIKKSKKRGIWSKNVLTRRILLPFHTIGSNIRENIKKQLESNLYNKCTKEGLTTPKLISYGNPISVEDAIKRCSGSGHGAIDPVEGCVWRIERDNSVDFIVKYVRHDKVDGKYIESVTGKDPVWNIII